VPTGKPGSDDEFAYIKPMSARAPAETIAALAERRPVGGPGRPDGDVHDVQARAERFVLAEARMLDERRLEDWLDLWHPHGLLWAPLDPTRGEDPATHQCLVLDDRTRLGERVQRLSSRAAWSQIPPTRTLRHLGNVEAWVEGDVGGDDADGGAIEVRSVLTLHAHRPGPTGGTDLVAARQEHRLVQHRGLLRIELKVVDLLDADAAQPNLSYLL
jgi:3-phenylpropionate/cinnamic acid dioxygenase small subunit